MSSISSEKTYHFDRFQGLYAFAKTVWVLLLLVWILELQLVQFPIAHAQLTQAWAYVWQNLCHRDDWFAFVVATNVWGTLVYWFVGLIYISFDVTRSFTKYKMQPGENEPLDFKKTMKCVAQVFFNQCIVGPLFAAAMLPVLRWRGIDFSAEHVPGLPMFFRHLAGYAICEEIGFYYAHRMFHESTFLYKTFHKQHHEYTAPIGISARYAHPVEDVLANVLPVFMGPLVTGSPLVFWWIWLLIGLASTVTSHSGYHLPFMPSGEFHDFHHLAFNTNYGALGLLDSLHFTHDKFISNRASLRHKMLTSGKSARELVPDQVVVG